MKINEIVFQGAFDVRAPVKLAFDHGVQSLELPEQLTLDDAHSIFVALFYPDHLSDEARQRVELGRGIKMAASFSDDTNRYRVLRREGDDSLLLQMFDSGRFKDVAGGPKIGRVLTKNLGFPDYAVFRALNLWRYDEPLPSGGDAGEITRLDPSQRALVEKYKAALDVERNEDEVKSAEGRIEEARKKLGESVKLEEKLAAARAKLEQIDVTALSEDDLELLRQRDDRLETLALQLQRLSKEEEETSFRVDESLPDGPQKNPLFIAGVLIVLAATGTSIANMETMRAVACANVLGLAFVAWSVLRYYTDMERVGIHLVKLDSIKRRINQVRDEQISYKDRLNHLLVHAGAQNEAELIERDEKSTKLRAIIAKMEAALERERQRPDYLQAREELAEYELRLEELREIGDSLPPSMLTSYQLETDLKGLGIDPARALEMLEESRADGAGDDEGDGLDDFGRLSEIASRAGQLAGGALHPPTLRMWAKICGHVLGSRFKGVDLVDGQLRIDSLTDDQLAMWRRSRAQEADAVAAALALALLINMPSRYGRVSFLVTTDPAARLGSDYARKLREVLKSAAKKTQIVLLEV
jgi:hypothetical protein